MKKILASIMTIAIVSAVGIYTTRAYFSDTETSTGNTISAGTIDISVDGQNPWKQSYTEQWTDFKPDVVQDMTFVVKNEGENPVVLRKRLGTFVEGTGSVSEPECEAEQGEWDGSACTENAPKDDISSVVLYGMTITPEDGSPIEIIPEEWNITMGDMKDVWASLGSIDPGKTLTVTQTYRLLKTAGNEYQGDTVSFTIDLYAEQRMGPGPSSTHGIVLENKTGDPNWYSIMDGTWGLLTWDASGNYTFRGHGLNNGLTYHLSYFNGTSESSISSAGTPSSGELTLTGTYAGLNANVGAKYWLRPSTYSNADTLWEGNVVN